MNDLPEPLTPADADLRPYPTMPLHVARLRDSGIAAHENAEVFRSAVLLWCAAWHQLPAGSLPDDDRELAAMAGFGRFISEWKAVKAEALRGFIKCSDGRLYHPVIAEVVLPAWEARKVFVDRSIRANEAKKARQKGDATLKDTNKATLKDASEGQQGSLKGHLGHPSERNGTERIEDTSADALVVGINGETDLSDGDHQVPVPPSAKPKESRTKGTRLRPDWFASGEDRQYARLIGFTDDEIDEVEEDFRCWWPAQAGAKGIKVDWSLTWKTWIRTEAKKRGKIKGTSASGRGQQSADRLGAFHNAGMAVAGKRISRGVG